MTIAKLIEKNPLDQIPVAAHQPIRLMSRIRLARNLEGYSFPGWSDLSQRMQVYELCNQAIEKSPLFNPCVHFSIESLDRMERQFLVERHLISKELSEGKTGSGVSINDDQRIAIMINEEDHLRIQVMSPSLGLNALWALSDDVDNQLERHVDYAFRDHYGYLTACPTNLGTGMRASVMLHLPGLVMTKQMERVVRAVNQLGIVARGMFGESTEPSGSIFQISNQQTLGEVEKDIISRLDRVITTIIEQEHNARIRLFEEEGNLIIDRIYRAYGLLLYANLISSTETINLLSMLRLASDIGMLPDETRMLVDKLMMDTQPSHLQFARHESLDSDARDLYRAQTIRDTLLALPEPNVDTIDFSLRSEMQDTDHSYESPPGRPDSLE